MPNAGLSRLSSYAPLRILLVNATDDASLSFAGLVHPLRVTADLLGKGCLIVQVQGPDAVLRNEALEAHLVLFVAADELLVEPEKVCAVWEDLSRRCGRTALRGVVGTAADYVVDGAAPGLFDLDREILTCRGGAASIDFALTIIEAIYGQATQSEVMAALHVEQVRRSGAATAGVMSERFGALQPKLAEALQLMESHIEEPLATDDIANLVGMSRRQLERLFKQFLGNVPSRYYLELRLRHARQLLLDSHHSIVQVGLMCGFSSGSHFSTAYGALFGLTPREERQRKLSSLSALSLS